MDRAPQAEVPRKGSDFRYVDKFDDLLQCGICKGALFQPQETECEHYFCRACIETHITAQGDLPYCPSCSEPVSSIHPFKKTTKLIRLLTGKLRVACAKRDGNGRTCGAIYDRDSHMDHARACEWRMVACPKGCGQTYAKKDQKIHDSLCQKVAFTFQAAAAAAAADPLQPPPQQQQPPPQPQAESSPVNFNGAPPVWGFNGEPQGAAVLNSSTMDVDTTMQGVCGSKASDEDAAKNARADHQQQQEQLRGDTGSGFCFEPAAAGQQQQQQQQQEMPPGMNSTPINSVPADTFDRTLSGSNLFEVRFEKTGDKSRRKGKVGLRTRGNVNAAHPAASFPQANHHAPQQQQQQQQHHHHRSDEEKENLHTPTSPPHGGVDQRAADDSDMQPPQQPQQQEDEFPGTAQHHHHQPPPSSYSWNSSAKTSGPESAAFSSAHPFTTAATYHTDADPPPPSAAPTAPPPAAAAAAAAARPAKESAAAQQLPPVAHGHPAKPSAHKTSPTSASMPKAQDAAEQQKQRKDSAPAGRSKKPSSKKLKMGGDDAYEKGDYDTAINLWSQAVDLDDGTTRLPIVYGNRSAAHFMSQRYVECIQDCRLALEDDRGNAKLWNRMGKAACSLGKIGWAIKLLQEALLEPKVREKGDHEIDVLDKELDVYVAIETAMKTAEQLISEGKVAEAESGLQHYFAKFGDWPQVMLSTCKLYIAKGMPDEALSIVEKPIHLARLKPGAVDGELVVAAFVLKAQALLSKGFDKMKEAINATQEGLIAAPNTKELLELAKRCQLLEEKKEKGNERFRAKEWHRSCQLYSEGLELATDTAEVAKVLHTNRAAARKEMKQFKLAVDDCTAALKLDPKFARAYTRRGRCHQELNDFDQAIADFKAAQRCGNTTQDLVDMLRDAERRRDAKVDFYSLLGVSHHFDNKCEKTQKELKGKYRELCLRWHPDKVRGTDDDRKEAEKKIKQVNEAYATLTDAVKRKDYDRTIFAARRSSSFSFPGYSGMKPSSHRYGATTMPNFNYTNTYGAF
ncbi:DnaJ-like protein subfamily C member 7-like protein [Diplonema papillatum]|nr:DnaJ-like protein subfamily C member 7-like protein [Diplonema papillatum]